MKQFFAIGAASVVLLLAAAPVQGAEVSLMSGIYKQADYETDGDDAGKESTIDLGTRYGDKLDEDTTWYGQGRLTMRSYEEGELDAAPSNSTSLSLGYGTRFDFDSFTETSFPYLTLLGEYKNDKRADINGNSFTETEKNGLYYSAGVGVRVGLTIDVFLDLESQLFESALFATEKTETTTVAPDGSETSSESETQKTELFVDSFEGFFNSVTVSVGMLL